jgi:hypothetical protein
VQRLPRDFGVENCSTGAITCVFATPPGMAGGAATRKEGFKFFFVIHGSKCRFPGLLVSAEPRNLCDVAQKLGRLVHHMFYCGLAGGFLKAHKY